MKPPQAKAKSQTTPPERPWAQGNARRKAGRRCHDMSAGLNPWPYNTAGFEGGSGFLEI
ncbi:hypothetical protein [Fretibacter rubidus]|uniref:hypothetical protein n=1 Tax=Fretibacter rubidus TaxID=570162 RepID=UPI00352AC5D2